MIYLMFILTNLSAYFAPCYLYELLYLYFIFYVVEPVTASAIAAMDQTSSLGLQLPVMPPIGPLLIVPTLARQSGSSYRYAISFSILSIPNKVLKKYLHDGYLIENQNVNI
jgi:hypothetical protein